MNILYDNNVPMSISIYALFAHLFFSAKYAHKIPVSVWLNSSRNRNQVTQRTYKEHKSMNRILCAIIFIAELSISNFS